MDEYKVTIRQSAVDDLKSLHFYITNHLLNPTAADKIVNQILDAADGLGLAPERGRLLGSDSNGRSVRMWTVKK